MTIVLILVALVVVIYSYGAIVFYYGLRNWYPMCGCKKTACSLKRPS